MTDDLPMAKRALKSLSKSENSYIRKEARRISLEVRAGREAAGLTQEGLAEKLGVSVETIKGIELGYHFASLPMLIRICRALGFIVLISKK